MARTILIVDDEESIIQSLDGILTDEGFDVISASSGVAALETIDEVMPDLVLLYGCPIWTALRPSLKSRRHTRTFRWL